MQITLLKKIPWLVFSLLIVIIDHLSKIYVYEWLSQANKVVEICSIFNIVLVWNKGISFGLFGNLLDSNLVFTVIACALTIFLLIWFIKTNSGCLTIVGLSMVIGGAIGNLWDRFKFGAVLDFLEFHLGPYYYPSFNIADSCVCVGVGLLLLSSFSAQNKN